jgi:hypothetical protein
MEIGDLTQGMDAGVRSPGADESDLLARHEGESGFDGSLDGGVAFLPLPSAISGAVVFDDQFEIFCRCGIFFRCHERLKSVAAYVRKFFFKEFIQCVDEIRHGEFGAARPAAQIDRCSFFLDREGAAAG